MTKQSKNLPQHVLFEPNYVHWKGLRFAIKDAKRLGVPLAVKTETILKSVQQYIKFNEIDIEVKLLEN